MGGDSAKIRLLCPNLLPPIICHPDQGLQPAWRDLLSAMWHSSPTCQTILPQHQIVEHRCYVYILASKSRTLYIGVTNDLTARVLQHRSSEIDGFTSDYKVHRLVYYEQHAWIQHPIAREKQLKRWRREKKVWLIERENPTWEDPAADLGKPVKLRRRNPANATDSRSLHAG